MDYFSPDLSGTLENYKVPVDIFTLYQQGQKIVFANGPIFLDTLVVTDVADANVTLVDGVDWEAQTGDLNTTVMSRMKSQDAAFDRILIDSITILKDFTSGTQRVNMSYQKLYPVIWRASIDGAGGIDMTPALIAEMLSRITAMESAVGGATNMVVPNTITPAVLSFDQNGTDPNNAVVDEPHVVNVFSYINLIRPVHGAFFRDSVVVTITDSSEVLVEGTDYLIKGLSQAYTSQTTNTSGVYNLIHIIREMATEVTISYQAVGGAVTPEAMREVIIQTNNISEYLGARAFLTPESLVTTTPYQSVINRMTSLEDQMRALATTGNPNYGDSTNGTTVVKQLAAADVQQHWWNIASLYTVDGSTDVFLSDRIRLRLKLVGAKLMVDLVLGVDLTLSRDNFTVSVDAAVQNMGYDLFGASDVAPPAIPQFRVIWNDLGGNPTSGIILQMGTALPGLTDTLAVEDYSGIESAWKILPYGGSPENPADDTILLPDGSSTWDSLSVTSFALVKTMPTKKPIRAWEGAVAFDALDIATPLTHVLPDYFRAEDVKSAKVVVTDGDLSISYTIEIPMISSAPGVCSGRASIAQAAGAPTDDVVLTLNTTGASPVMNLGSASGAAWSATLTNHDVNYVLLDI